MLLVFTTLFSDLVTSPEKVSAGELANLALNEDLTDWVMDEPNNQIYAVTSTGTLHFISLSSLSIESSLDLAASSPSELDMYSGTLYVTFAGNNLIKTVDISTKALERDINVLNAPNEIAVHGNQLIYADGRLYSYNLDTDQETEIVLPEDEGAYSPYEQASLKVDHNTDTLYVGESNMTGSVIDAISTTDYSLKTRSTYDDGYGFSLPERKIVLDNQEIFYAGKRLDANNLENIKGTYVDDADTSKETAYEVIGNYVFTDNDIFTRMTFEKVADLPFETEFILGSSMTNVYMFNPADQTIYQYSFNPQSTDSTTTTSNNRLLLNDQLSDWEYDETNQRLYGISQESNTLYYINPDTMEVENKKFVGSMPSDIDLVNNELFIANFGGTNITRESTTYQPSTTNDINNEPVTYLTTKQNPYNITTDGTSTLFYAPEDQHINLHHIDLSTETEQLVPNNFSNLDTFYEADIELDATNDTLYIGESGSTGSQLFSIDASTFGAIKESSQDFSTPNREVILDGSDIFYAMNQFDTSALTTTNLYTDPIIYVNANYVFTKTAVYERGTTTKVADFPCTVNLVTTDSTGRVFAQPEDKSVIYRFDSASKVGAIQPTNFTANFNVSDEFILDWDTMTADDYTVEYKTSGMSYFDTLKNSLTESQLQVTPSQFKPWFGDTVTFRVTTNICDIQSNPAQKVYEFVIKAPENQQYAENTKGEHLLTWDAVPYMEGYRVYYKDTESVSSINNLFTETQANVTEQALGEWQGKTLQLAVVSTINGLESDQTYNITKTFDVVPPKNLQYALNEQGQHILSWDGVPYTEGYTIYYKEEGSTSISSFDQLISGTQLDVTDKATGEWQDKTMQFAVTSNVNGAESTQTFDVTQSFDVQSPNNLKLTANAEGQFFLTWDANAYADGYNLYFQEDGATTISSLGNALTETQYDVTSYVTGDWMGKTLNFAVTAKLNGTESSQSFSLTKTFDGSSSSPSDDTSTDTSGSTDGDSTGDSNTDTSNDSTNDTTEDPTQEESNTEDDSSYNSTPVIIDDNYEEDEEDNQETELTDEEIDEVIEHILEGEDGETTAEIEVEVFDKDIFIKRTTTQPIEIYEYESENDSDYVDFSISKSFLDSAKEEEGEEKHLYIKSNSGSYQLPLEMTDFSDISEDAKIEVSIRESSDNVQESISRHIDGDEDLELVSRPMNFEVNIIEDDTVTKIESFGTQYVERSIVLDREVDADQTLVVTYNEETDSIYTVPARIEIDEDGNTVAIFNRNGNSTYAVLQMKDKTFKDIQDHWAKKEIESLASQLIIEGRSNGNFDPEANVTRAEYAVLLTRAMGLTPNKDTKVPYEDVSKDDWYYTQLQSAIQANLLGGYNNDQFKPNQALTREELMEMTARALIFVNGEMEFKIDTLTTYHDANKLKKTSLEYVSAVIQAGIIQGTSQNNLLPNNTTTRAESAVVLKRLMSKFYFNN